MCIAWQSKPKKMQLRETELAKMTLNQVVPCAKSCVVVYGLEYGL